MYERPAGFLRKASVELVGFGLSQGAVSSGGDRWLWRKQGLNRGGGSLVRRSCGGDPVEVVVMRSSEVDLVMHGVGLAWGN